MKWGEGIIKTRIREKKRRLAQEKNYKTINSNPTGKFNKSKTYGTRKSEKGGGKD